MISHLTSCGIPGVGVVPYGFHMCNFYPSRQDLIDGLIPYFRAGLEQNERGIWIAASPLPNAAIRMDIANSPELESGLASGQLRILDAAEWYGEPVTLTAEEIVQRWLDEEERALADGYQGLRIAETARFRPRDDWGDIIEYEMRLHDRLRNRRIVACCSYHSRECRPVDMLEIVRCHDAALDRSDEHWDVSLKAPHVQARKNGGQRRLELHATDGRLGT